MRSRSRERLGGGDPSLKESWRRAAEYHRSATFYNQTSEIPGWNRVEHSAPRVGQRIGGGVRIVLINLRNSPLMINLEGEFTSFITNKKAKSFKLKENEFEILIEKK